jgi:hypothetical protein
MSRQESKTMVRMSMQFGNYVVQHPKLLNGITRKDRIIVTVKSQPKLWKKNMALAKLLVNRDKRRCFLAMRTRAGWKLEKVMA